MLWKVGRKHEFEKQERGKQMKRMLGILLLMALVSFGSSHLMAQWIQTNGPEGGGVGCFAVSDTNLFAGTGGGVYRSTNNGTSWTPVNTGLWNLSVYALAVSGTKLFAGTQGNGVWRRPLSEMPTSVEIVSSEPALTFSLEQNYPNPFNPTTVIQFRVKSSESRAKAPVHTTLNIYNILGQKVRTLVDQYLKAGHKAVEWDGKDDWGKEVSSGIYFYRLQTEDFTEAKKMLLIK